MSGTAAITAKNTNCNAEEESNQSSSNDQGMSSANGVTVDNSKDAATKMIPDNIGESNKSAESKFVRPAYIPPHLMGRDLNNPASDMIGTGRRIQKPRLGVKVPYRNLTSQIVSQDEIAQEILERSLRKYSYTDVPEGGDVFFAMKLTHRLANKINTGDNVDKPKKVRTPAKKTPVAEKTNSNDIKTEAKESSTSLIDEAGKNNEHGFDSKAEELYAEISSTLNNENNCNIPKLIKPHPSANASPSKKTLNGSLPQPLEPELDDDTLLAILEGTTELNESTALTEVIADTGIVTSTPQVETNTKRKKRIKATLDPNREKELALKQLMDFEKNKSLDRFRTAINYAKAEETHNTSEKKQAETQVEKKVVKRTCYSLSPAPIQLVKKKQHIKRQLRSSISEAQSSSTDPPAKKVPHVPKVQATIDRYLKTYSHKRQLKPDNLESDKPIEKKAKKSECDEEISQGAAKANPKHRKVQPESADENRNEAGTSDHEVKKVDVIPKPKANSKVMREINRLLGDEGAINMIYSVEQERLSNDKQNTNYLASTKRKKKDLLLKTKLVKNAVLRLSMSSSQNSPNRGRRSSPEETKPTQSTASLVRKASIESVESNTSDMMSPKAIRKFAAEASKIIRRHSSSSAYSSDEETSSSSTANENIESSTVAASVPTPSTPKSTAKPSASNKSVASKNANVLKEEKPSRSSRRIAKENILNGKKNQTESTIMSLGHNTELFEQISLKEITIRKYENLVQIILISSSTKMKNALNTEILRELTSVLYDVQNDENCRIVLMTSTGSSFCQGIDLGSLICADKKKRSKIVTEYVDALTEFTKCLSQFDKLLIAGVHGSAVGLGVTMLPFFDMVIASDKATFYTPYVKLGQIPEAAATLTLPHLLGNAVTSELLFGCRMLTASEALQFGLVTRILWPDKFTEELLPLVKGIASHSSQSMKATKQLIRQPMNVKLPEQLKTETKLLKEHWCSEECQSRFKTYLEQEALLQNK